MRAGLDLSVQVSHQVGRDHFFLERGLDVLFLMFQVFWGQGGGGESGVSAAWRWILTGVGGQGGWSMSIS